MPAEPVTGLTDEFRSAVQECQRLYHEAGELCLRDHPQLIKTSGEEFLALMDDLSRGLLVKVFITIFKADWRWAPQELELALALCRDLWNEELTEAQLRPAIKHLMEREASLRWESLFRPFQKLPPLWDQIGALESVVLRLANLVAKADGKVHPNEVNEIRGIQEQLTLWLGHLPRQTPHTTAGQAASAQAVEQMRAEAVCAADDGAAPRKSTPPCEQKPPEQRLAEALAELHALIGLESVKTEVQGLVNLLRLQEQRRSMDLPTATLSLHMVFTGNPGVGKTTVARLVGRVFSALGILEKGHLIETDRSGLVAEYAGQTGPKTNKMIDAALDGVLFIDEAYSLRAEDGDDPFGAEAVQTLLKRMEDDRRRLVVVLAGYPAPVERLLRSNPGLSSRFSRAGFSRLRRRATVPHSGVAVRQEPIRVAHRHAGQAAAGLPIPRAAPRRALRQRPPGAQSV